MTSASVSKADHGQSRRHTGADRLIAPALWGWIAILAGLFILMHRNFLLTMGRIATGEWSGDWSHAMIVPLISGYFIYQNRHKLAELRPRVYWPGLACLFLGLFGFAWAIYPGRNDMIQGYCMILSLFGLVLFLLGPRMMSVLWFPIVYLAFGVKVSPRIWDQIAWALQRAAATGSAHILRFLGHFFGFEAVNRGSTIDISYWANGAYVTEGLNIAEACAGLRMLMAFLALGAAVAFLADRPWWQRGFMMLMAVPVALVVNVGRVTTLGILFIVDKELAQGSFHTFVGMLMLVPAFFLFMLMGWIMDRLFIEADEPAGAPPTAPIASVGPAQAGAVSAQHEPPPGAFAGKWVFRGLVTGVALTALLGLTYGLGLGAMRPDLLGKLLAHHDAGPPMLSQHVLTVLLVVSSALTVGGFWLVRRMLYVPWRQPLAALRRAAQVRVVSLALAAGVLLCSVSGLNAVVVMTQAILNKEPIALRRPLYFIPPRMSTWEQIKEDEPLGPEAVEALGTKQYISRYYQNHTMSLSQPGAVVKLHVAYYTGTPDTVPHVPDRCYVAGGITPQGTSLTELKLEGPTYTPDPLGGWTASSLLLAGEPGRVGTGEPGRVGPASGEGSRRVHIPEVSVTATVFTFIRPGTTDKRSNVVYFFVANNKFLANPDLVRLQGFDPRDRYSYYCKVEVGFFDVDDAREATRLASAFLSAVMPEIMACLPDWRQAKAQAPIRSAEGSQSTSTDQPMVR